MAVETRAAKKLVYALLLLRCFFLSQSPIGHVGSKCDIWHWFTCKGWMYACVSYGQMLT